MTLRGQYVQFTGRTTIDGTHRLRPELRELIKRKGAYAVPDGSRSRTMTLLVLGDLQDNVVDPKSGISKQLLFVISERASANHICVVTSHGLGMLLEGDAAPCQQVERLRSGDIRLVPQVAVSVAVTGSVPVLVEPMSVASILRRAIADADGRSVRSPTLDRLTSTEIRLLAEETLAFLRTRPSTDSAIPGWRQVGSFDAGVNRWWNDQIGSAVASDTAVRLRKLRAQTYDYLDDELGLISKAPGQNAPIHLSPDGDVLSPDRVDDAPREVSIASYGAGFGDAAKNRAVELAAMRRVVDHFSEWAHTDVSADKVGWDITLTRGPEVRHIEVKGVSGRQPSVLLTANEIRRAIDDPLWSLVVVTQALVAPVLHEFDRAAVTAAAEPYVFRAALVATCPAGA